MESIYPTIQNSLIISHNRFGEEFEREYGELFGVKSRDGPTLMIALVGKETVKYRYEGKMEKKLILEFIKKFYEGKLQRHYISE